MDELHLHFMGQGLDQGVAEGAKWSFCRFGAPHWA